MVEILSIQTIILTVIFGLFMFLFAYKDYKSYKTDNHQDYKSVIVSLGVLGTFVGIFIGLLGFDTTSIKDSVPILLEGLKTAFLTSIIGMFLSIYLSAIQKSSGQGEIEDELQVLNAINRKLEKLSTLDNIDEKLKNLDTLSLINTKLDSMDTNIKTLSQDISSVKEEMKTNQSMLFEFLEKSLNTINQSLDEAIDKLAEGATGEIIKALENVIQDFNKNLTEQFGESFKQLNESVKNMIVWQNNYKHSILEFEKQLEIILGGTESNHQNTIKLLENFSSSNHQLLLDNTENINKIINNNTEMLIEKVDNFSAKINKSLVENVEQNEQFNKKIKENLENLFEQTKVAVSTTEENAKQISQITDDYSSIEEISKKLKSTLETNENQIKNLELHLKTFTEISENAKGMTDNIKNFSEEIQGSLTAQSKTLVDLTEELEKTLPTSLDTLNKSLTSLTKQFASDYESFLEQISKLMRANNTN